MEASGILCNSFPPQLPPPGSDNFFIEDFLNLPNDASFESLHASTCNSHPALLHHVDGISPAKPISSVTSPTNFTGDLCVPWDDFPGLSNIVDEPISSEDLQKMELISGLRERNDSSSETMWEMELISDVKGENDDTLVTYHEMELLSGMKERNDDASKSMWEMELISYVKTQNNDTFETMHNIDVKARNYDVLEIMQNLGEEAEIQYASGTVQKQEMISCMKGPNNEKIEMMSHVKRLKNEVLEEPNQNGLMFDTEVFVPAKSRSKRPCGPPSDWTSRLLLLSPTTMSSELEPILELEPQLKLELELELKQRNKSPIPTLNPSVIGVSPKKPTKSACKRKDNNDGGSGGDGRRCLHCATDKTPQWRTGPMGPKTLCNACGVRYKSGRLVPEYRPAASPTFVMSKHSNSHRKVMELRRQKEVQRVDPIG